MVGRYDDWKGAVTRAGAGTDEGKPDYIKDVAASLEEIASTDVARLPEDTFREVFMPLFTKLFQRLLLPAQGMDDAAPLKYPKESTVAGWISVAGTPYREVDIFDPTLGTVLFRCPPLFDQNGVNPVRQAADRVNPPIAEIAAMSEKLRLVHPHQSEAYLVRELSKRTIFMNAGAQLANNVIRWNDVFKRYGRQFRIGQVNTDSTPSSSVGQPQSGPATEAEYEDF